MSSMNSHRPFILAALAAIVLTPAVGADTPHRTSTSDSIADYVRARAADDLGELSVAANGFAAAAAQNPGDTRLGLRAFRQAVAAGDMALAVKSAQALDAAKSLPPDGTLLLFADAVERRDWKRANQLTDRITAEKLFAFMVPVMHAWIAYGARQGDPLTPLQAVPVGSLASTYADEHTALLLIATGKETAGVAAIGALQLTDGGRAARLRVAAAAALDHRHKHDAALAMLTGDAPPVRLARAALDAHRKLPGAIDTPAAGIAELYVRIAADLNKQQAAPLALGFARMATMLAPDASEGWLVSATLLSLGGADDAALEAVSHVAPSDPFAGAARDTRLTLLVRAGHADQALAEAQAAAQGAQVTAGDWARLGDLLANAKRPADAAQAYARALQAAGGDSAVKEVAWPLLLQQANALLEAGDWPTAKALATRALALAPQQPEVLNFLGYSELEQGQDVAGAGALIAQASALAPNDASITDSLGWSWYLRGRVDRAIPLLERAAQGAPAESDINEHLGDAYWKADRKLDARYAWRAALVVADGDQAVRIKTKIDDGLSAKP
jgi:Flp pilus assembly protein TadD